MFSEKIQIKLRSYDHRTLDKDTKKVVNILKKHGVKIKGPIPFPLKIIKHIVNRSPHVNKKSMEKFELTTHLRSLWVENPNNKLFDLLKSIVLSAGTDVDVVFSK